jgi:hypothetical protein
MRPQATKDSVARLGVTSWKMEPSMNAQLYTLRDWQPPAGRNFCAPQLAPVHKKPLLTYLRLSDKRLGLLIKFRVPLIKDGITRIIDGLEDEDYAQAPRRKGA